MTERRAAEPPVDFEELTETLQQEMEASARKAAANPRYERFSAAYRACVEEWFRRDFWEVRECANLLCGLVPNRPMGLRGDDHARLDSDVRQVEALIENCLGESLPAVERSRVLGVRRCPRSAAVVPWARDRELFVPAEMMAAHRERHGANMQSAQDGYPAPDQVTEMHAAEVGSADSLLAQYSTPEIHALLWVVKKYWVGVDLANAPKKAVVVQDLIESYGMSESLARAIDSIARHPDCRKGGQRSSKRS